MHHKLFRTILYNYYNTNFGIATADASYLGKILYTAAFADIDPERKADETFQALLGEPVCEHMAKSFHGFGELNLGE